jgi:hypothetical protein
VNANSDEVKLLKIKSPVASMKEKAGGCMNPIYEGDWLNPIDLDRFTYNGICNC